MNLGTMLLERLRSLDGDTVVTVGEHGQQATLTLADADRYSVALCSLTVGGAVNSHEDTQTFLSAKAAAIVRQLNYLEEPLAVWELDGGERIAQLRSSPPEREGEGTYYWQIELHAGEQPFATLARYHWKPAMPERRQVEYPATFALVARLTNSLAQALAD